MDDRKKEEGGWMAKLRERIETIGKDAEEKKDDVVNKAKETWEHITRENKQNER